MKVSENINLSWPDDVYMRHEKQQHLPYGTYIEWNWYILKLSSQPASKVVIVTHICVPDSLFEI